MPLFKKNVSSPVNQIRAPSIEMMHLSFNTSICHVLPKLSESCWQKTIKLVDLYPSNFSLPVKPTQIVPKSSQPIMENWIDFPVILRTERTLKHRRISFLFFFFPIVMYYEGISIFSPLPRLEWVPFHFSICKCLPVFFSFFLRDGK